MLNKSIFFFTGTVLFALGASGLIDNRHPGSAATPSLGAANSANQIYQITSTDQSIQGVIDMAIDGDTIAIATDDVFYQSFVVNKTLNVVAADGFTPSFQRATSGRSRFEPIIELPAVPGKSVTLKLDGLTIGDPDLPGFTSSIMDISGAFENYTNTFIIENSDIGEDYEIFTLSDSSTGANDKDEVLLRHEVINSTLYGGSYIKTRSGGVYTEVTDSTVSRMIISNNSPFGGHTLKTKIANTTFTSSLSSYNQYGSESTIFVEDSTLNGVGIISRNESNTNVSISRSYIEAGVYVYGNEGAPSVLEIDNSLLVRGSRTFHTIGLYASEYARIEANNVTVVDYSVAIRSVSPESRFTNMILLDSRITDVDYYTSPDSVSSSLISDGEEGDGFVGVRGNISGQPDLDDQFNLLPGSLGIDAGDNNIEQSLDYAGAPRIQDGDTDGSAQVDMGAYEYQVESDGLSVDGGNNIDVNNPVAVNSWGSGFNATYEYEVQRSDTEGGALQHWRIEADTASNFHIANVWISGGYDAGVQSFYEADTFVLSNENEEYVDQLVTGDVITFTVQGNGAGFDASDMTLNFVVLSARASAEGVCTTPEPVSLPFSFDGEGEHCWEISGNVKYVNSWNTDSVTINGNEFANRWSNSLPAAIDGKYTVLYNGLFPWSHFEVGGSN